MGVKAGYKQTDMGVIPEDWEVASLGKIASIHRGKFSARPRNDPKYYGGDIPFIQTGDVARSRGLITDFSQTLNAEGLKVSRLFPKGTLFFTIAANIGDVGITVFDAACPDSLVAITPEPFVDKHWLFAELGKRKSEFENLASPGAQLNINLEKLRPFLLPLPPLPEQRAIAAALSDVDGALAGVLRLISKKRDLKQAAMQNLLTGQTRLPGFLREWPVKRLGDHVRFLKNGTHSRAQLAEDGPVRNLHYGDIHGASSIWLAPAHRPMPTLDALSAASLERLASGDLIFVDASEDLDGVGKSVEITEMDDLEVVSGLHTIAARFDKSILADGFKGYLQFVPAFRNHLCQLAAGTKVLATNRAHVASVEIKLPEPPEQTAIAAILSDMDAEIAALTEQAEKTRLIKQAMMQELLTGRTRLPIPEDAHA